MHHRLIATHGEHDDEPLWGRTHSYGFTTIDAGARFASSCGAGFGGCVIGMATKGGMQPSARSAIGATT